MVSSDRIGLDYLTLFGVSPPDFIRTAAAAGARSTSLFLTNLVNPFNLPEYSLADDAALRRETVRCAKGEGVSIALMEGLWIYPDQSVEQHRRNLDVMAELGARCVNTVSFDPSWERTVDETARLTAMAAEHGVTVAIEACPLLTIATLARALELVSAISLPNLKLTIDTLHIGRTQETDLLARIDPDLIAYVQISDGPLISPSKDAYTYEAAYQRALPGEGEMPLLEILRLIRRDVIVSGEAPQRAKREAGVTDLDIARSVINGTRKTLAAAGTS